MKSPILVFRNTSRTAVPIHGAAFEDRGRCRSACRAAGCTSGCGPLGRAAHSGSERRCASCLPSTRRAESGEAEPSISSHASPPPFPVAAATATIRRSLGERVPLATVHRSKRFSLKKRPSAPWFLLACQSRPSQAACRWGAQCQKPKIACDERDILRTVMRARPEDSFHASILPHPMTPHLQMPFANAICSLPLCLTRRRPSSSSTFSRPSSRAPRTPASSWTRRSSTWSTRGTPTTSPRSPSRANGRVQPSRSRSITSTG